MYPTIKMLVSFADHEEGHIGTIYKAANWVHDGEVEPSYYYMLDGRMVHKKTVWDRAKKMQMLEINYANANGYTKIPSKSKSRFILKLG
jgi:hypothetical protein